MNNFAKGSIAAGAGIVLLLGGAGTFALWNGATDVDAGSVNAGLLELDATGTGAWEDGAGDPVDIATLKWVPGDAYTYTDEITIDAEGDSIEATLSVDEATIVSGGTAADDALKDELEVDFDVDLGAVTGGTLTDNGDGTFDIDGPGTYVVPIEVTVSFPSLDPTFDNATQEGSVDLSDLGFVVEQHL